MRRVLAAVFVASSIVVSTQTAGVAASLPGANYRLTMYGNDSYTGCSLTTAISIADFRDYTCSSYPNGFDNRLSSFVNKTADWWILAEDRNRGGAWICVRPNSHDNNIGNDTGYEDDISSAYHMGTSQPSGCDDVTGTAN